MRITKVKVEGDKIIIKFEKESLIDPSKIDRFGIESKDAPLPSFRKALKALSVLVVSICEFTGEDSLDYIVTGVTLTYGDDNGIVITAQKPLENLNIPVNINTPFATMEFIGLDGKELVANLQAEAVMYVNGEKAQLKLFKKAS